jgi:TonB family protein
VGGLGESFLRTTSIPLATESLLNELDRCAQDPVIQPQAPLTQAHEPIPQSRISAEQQQPPVTASSAAEPIVRPTVRSAEIYASQAQTASDEVPIGVLEVPIGVWGSRRGTFTSGQSGRIEVFAEETSTVIVFPHGAVIRLSAAVAPGQMMMVTNRNTNQVAACRVVKSRNYPNAKGYAEVEFFRPTIDFWGGYSPQGTMKLAASPTPEKRAQDFWSSGYTPEMINVLANVSSASPVPFPAARNKVTPVGSRARQIPSLEKANHETLTLTPVLVQAASRNENTSERSWIRDFLSSLPGQVVALSGADRNYSPKPRMAFAWITATCLLITVLGTGLYLRQRGAVVMPAATAETNATTESSAGSSTANATESAQPGNNSSSLAAPGVPLIAKTENFPGSQSREFGYSTRASQPPAKTSSLERKMSNGKPLAAPSVVRHSPTVIGKEMPPNVAGMNSNTVAPTTPGIFAALMSPGGRVKEAQLVSKSAPNYPIIAKQAGVEGEVTVSAVIDITGKLTNMKILSGSPMLQQAALDSLRTWKYEPAFLNDKPVPVQTSITVKFRIH